MVAMILLRTLHKDIARYNQVNIIQNNDKQIIQNNDKQIIQDNDKQIFITMTNKFNLYLSVSQPLLVFCGAPTYTIDVSEI